MTNRTDSSITAIAGALGALLRVDVLILVCWSLTLVYIVVQDRADRQYADQRHELMMEQANQRHQEIMESIRAVPGQMIQQVRVEQKNNFHETLAEKIWKDRHGNVPGTTAQHATGAGDNNGVRHPD